MNRRRIAIGLILLGTLSLGACSVTTVREHPSLEEQLEQIDGVVIAPPAVNVTLVTFDGDNRRLAEEEDRIREELIRVAKRELTEHSFDVIEFDFDQAVENDDEFAFAVEQVIDGYHQARKTLYKALAVSEQDKRKFKTSVGEVVNMIADKTGADAVLLIEYDGIKKSRGKMAQEVAAGVLLGLLTGYVATPVSTGSSVEVALVDAWTGDVLWTNVQAGVQLNAQSVDVAMDSFPDDIDPAAAEGVTGESSAPELARGDISESGEHPRPQGPGD